MTNCKIIQDLLPLYIDGLVSTESQVEIEQHLKLCETCSTILKRMQKGNAVTEEEHTEFKIILQKFQKKRRKKIIISVSAILLLLTVGFLLWSNGFFHIIERKKSPDGNTVTTVYNCRLSSSSVPKSGGFTLVDNGKYRGRTIYTDAKFQGLWWSLEGNYQVVSMIVNDEIWLSLTDYQRNCGVNLDGRLDMSLYKNEFFKDVIYNEETGQKLIEFQFIQWNPKDESKMLIYFYYTDSTQQFQEGYFWDDYETGHTYGEMEIEQGEKAENMLNNLL